MKRKTETLPTVQVESLIFTIRGHKVLMDSELARLYGVETKRLNEQVKRNAERFPEDFAFRLTRDEAAGLRSQFATSNARGGRRFLPLAFTEHGAITAANVLNTTQAVAMSVYVVRAFIRMREELAVSRAFAQRLVEIEKTLIDHDAALRELFQKIRPLLLPPQPLAKRKIGFEVKEPRARYGLSKQVGRR